jgi:hypothetical protein
MHLRGDAASARRVLPAIVMLLVVPVSARAADGRCAKSVSEKARPEATRLLAEGRLAMTAARYEDALQLFERAFCVAPESSTRHALSSAELNLGRCEEALRTARRWSADVTSQVERDEARAWSAELSRQCVAVSLDVDIPSAVLRIDDAAGAPVAVPWQGLLRAGRHMVFVTAEGSFPLQQQITVPSGERGAPLRVALKLTKEPPACVGLVPLPTTQVARAADSPSPHDRAAEASPPAGTSLASTPVADPPAGAPAASLVTGVTPAVSDPADTLRADGPPPAREPSNPGANVPRGLWLTKLKDNLPSVVCDTAYFKECFSTSRDECITAGQRTQDRCVDEQLPFLPDYLDAASGRDWGARIGNCFGIALESALTPRRKPDPRCNDASLWQ